MTKTQHGTLTTNMDDLTILCVYTVALVSISTAAICYCFYLYHKAHGRDVDAVVKGAQIVIDALQQDGRIEPLAEPADDGKPWHVDSFGEEDQAEEEEEGPYDDILVARSQRAAEQMGKVELDKVMNAMDGKV